MKRIPKFCIALSAAVLLTGGLASANDDNMPNHWNRGVHSGFFAELNSLASTFQALAEHIKQEEARKEQERIEEQRLSEWLFSMRERLGYNPYDPPAPGF